MNFNLENYDLVSERLTEFYKRYPDGVIIPEIVSDLSKINEYVVVKASLWLTAGAYQNGDKPVSIGHAYEKAGGLGASKHAWVMNCFHEETEFLTKMGWKHFYDVTNKDLLAQVELKQNNIFFSKYKNKIIRPEKEFYLIEDNLTAQCVTKDHDLIIDNKKHKIFSLKKNKKYNIKHYSYKGGIGLPHSNDFIKLLQWIIADGNIIYPYNYIRFGFKKERKISRIQSILKRLSLKFKKQKSQITGITTFYLKNCENIIKYLPRKTLTFDLAMKMNPKQASIFIDEILYTDGTKCTNINGIFLRQTDIEYFENLNLLAILNGYSVTGIKYHEKIRCFNKKLIIFRARYVKGESGRKGIIIKKIKYNIPKYAVCFEMPHGTLITRLKGKITISGNCETSSFGRVLANRDIWITKPGASKEEIEYVKECESIADVHKEEEHLIPKLSDAQIKRIFAIGREKGWEINKIKQLSSFRFKKSSLHDLERKEYDAICEEIGNFSPEEIRVKILNESKTNP